MLERGEAANSWRRERWDSLRLLTPNWQSRLPGHHYEGRDPDGYMTMREVVDFISRYAVVTAAPVRTHTTVTSVTRTDVGYTVTTNTGVLQSRAVVLASGACNVPSVPSLAQALPPHVQSVTPFDYRNPGHLPDGGVLVVGASATGVQLADEIARSGRAVVLSVGEHVRLPRTYRGRDVLWWMDASGVWNQRYDEVDDLMRARGLPSPQLVDEQPEPSQLPAGSGDHRAHGPKRERHDQARPSSATLHAGCQRDGDDRRSKREGGAAKPRQPVGADRRS